MVIIKSSQKIKVYLIVIKDVGVYTHEPDEKNKVPKSSPNGKSSLKVVICRKVNIKELKNKDDSQDYQDNSSDPKS